MSGDWRDRAVLTVEEARIGPFEGRISRATLYDAVKRGVVPSVHLGARILIPVLALRAMLGEVDARESGAPELDELGQRRARRRGPPDAGPEAA